MATDDGTLLAERAPSAVDDGGWTHLVDGAAAAGSRPRPPSVRRVVGRFVVANLIAVALLMAGSIWASRTAAEDEAIADARHSTDLIATLLLEPELDESLLAGDQERIESLDGVLRDRLSAADVLRVKIWTPNGRIVYSDEPKLIGRTYSLSDEDLKALQDGDTHAELSDLDRPENRFERSAGQLLEVYRQVRTPTGRPMLLETYWSYADATSRQMDIWFKFAPISVSVLLALLAMQLPLASRMVTQLRAAGRERELLQARALDASTEERRRIAGSLHDGIVQDVSASSLLVAGVADQLRERRASDVPESVAEDLGQASRALRDSAGSLRSLLVEIYPPNLERSGLAPALADLATRLRLRAIDVRTSVPDGLQLPLETATLLFRTAQEALLNVAKHARASNADVTVTKTSGALVMDIADDGVGFDPASALTAPHQGHLGLNVLADLAAAAGATLDIRSEPGSGTCVRLRVPLP
jgi:two-component system, NarL family, sensor kinase